jgi:hypothetical protein
VATIFSVAAKLLGVFWVYLGLQHVLTALVLDNDRSGSVPLLFLFGAVLFVLAFVLIFWTDALARLLRVDGNASAASSGFESEAVLRTGIILIGLYAFVFHIAGLLTYISGYIDGMIFQGLGGAPGRILVESIPLLLALLFIFRPDRIVQLVFTEERNKV